jgi:hypothetical protein
VASLALAFVLLLWMVIDSLMQVDYGVPPSQLAINILLALSTLFMLFLFLVPVVALLFFSWRNLKSANPENVKGMMGSWALLLVIFSAVSTVMVGRLERLDSEYPIVEGTALFLIPPVIWAYYRFSQFVLNKDGFPTGGFRDFVGKNTMLLTAITLWMFLSRVADPYYDLVTDPNTPYVPDIIILGSILIPIIFYKVSVKMLRQPVQPTGDDQINFRR